MVMIRVQEGETVVICKRNVPIAELRRAPERPSDVEPLPLTESAAAVVEALPRHHKDPFHRMLVATAIAHGLRLVSPDTAFEKYPVRIFW